MTQYVECFFVTLLSERALGKIPVRPEFCSLTSLLDETVLRNLYHNPFAGWERAEEAHQAGSDRFHPAERVCKKGGKRMILTDHEEVSYTQQHVEFLVLTIRDIAI